MTLSHSVLVRQVVATDDWLIFAVVEAVSEVKRQAMTELRKAVAESEQKASQLIAAERARLDAIVAEARKQAVDEILQSLRVSHESTEVIASFTQNVAAPEVIFFMDFSNLFPVQLNF